VPLSVAAGGLLTLLLAGARAAARALAIRARRLVAHRRARRIPAPRPVSADLHRPAPLAAARAGRAPPLLLTITA
jgi:hypothetical protein